MRPKITINPRGLMVAAQRLLGDDLTKAGRAVESGLDGYRGSVVRENNRDGRPVALVALAEPNGLAIEAKHGTLSNAARAAGLKVTRYPR